MKSTGIAVFAYNRPDHLKRVLAGLQKNNVDHIYFFADGPKNKQDKRQVEAVREVIDKVDWCQKNVTCYDHNLGLAKAVVRGVNRVFEDHDRIIVIEDDCVPATNFVSFMNTCLDRYAEDSQVMNVNGYSLPIEIPEDYPYDVYFTYRSSSWGWGTWKSAWEHFEQNPMTLAELNAREDELTEKIRKAGTDLFPMMRDQLSGRIDSWAVWWSFAIASNGGVCVNPVNSKIRNIGHDNTGTHTGRSDRYDVTPDTTSVGLMSFPKSVFVDDRINSRHNRFVIGGTRGKMKQLGAELLKSVGLWNTFQKLRSL
ncbi:glycosyltransferase family 2 protein [Haladaptatus sp. CMSO5]|uniref:glycosyltransferase family 2 protein n=1 Tax=Haladaptatus sp. CMSO5 TaxID=3120514 RepID=UPI002FCE3343